MRLAFAFLCFGVFFFVFQDQVFVFVSLFFVRLSMGLFLLLFVLFCSFVCFCLVEVSCCCCFCFVFFLVLTFFFFFFGGGVRDINRAILIIKKDCNKKKTFSLPNHHNDLLFTKVILYFILYFTLCHSDERPEMLTSTRPGLSTATGSDPWRETSGSGMRLSILLQTRSAARLVIRID